MLWVAALSVLVPFAILALVTVRLSTGAVREQADLRLDIAAQAGGVEVDQEMRGLSQLAEAYAQRPTVVEAMAGAANPGFDKRSIRPHLDQLLAARTGIAAAFVTDSAGTLLDAVPDTPEIIGQNFAYRDWYQGVTKGAKPYMSTVYRTAVTGHDLVVSAASAVPIRSSTSAVLGYLVVSYSTTTVQTFVDAFARVQGVSISVMDQNGSVVAASGAPPTGEVSRRTDPAVAAGLEGRTGHHETGADDTAELVAYAPVSSLGWVVTAQIPTIDALAETDHVRQVVRLTAAFLLVVIIGGLVVLLRSLRRRDQAERDLAASRRTLLANERRLSQALRAGELRTWEWDIAEGTFTSRSPDGAIEEGGSGQNPLDAVSTDDREMIQAAFAEAVEGDVGRDTDVDVEYRTVASDTTRWIAAQGRVERDDDGTAIAVIGVSRDVTDRHAAEDDLRESRDAADRANQAKNEFLSRMSHELRTPLNAVLGFSALLEMEDLSTDQKEYVEWIRSGGRHLLDLINDVLDIARIESGDMSLSPESFLVAEVVGSSLELIRPQAMQRGVSLPAELGGADVRVFADRQRLTQIMLNLLSNAVKYNRADGGIDVVLESSGGTVTIAVIDTGLGISPAGLSKLFTPFERLEAAATDIEGTGVGLALSRALSQQMGGALTVASTVGVGSTFTLELPSGDPPASSEDAVAPDSTEMDVAPASTVAGHTPVSSGTPTFRVLAVEDNVANIRLLERAFARQENVELLTAIQGSIGLELAGQHHPDLILLDLHLPDLPGGEVLRRLHDDPATAITPVVICSADASTSQIELLLAQGVIAYLTKPIDLTELFGIVDRLRSGRAVAAGSFPLTP